MSENDILTRKEHEKVILSLYYENKELVDHYHNVLNEMDKLIVSMQVNRTRMRQELDAIEDIYKDNGVKLLKWEDKTPKKISDVTP